MRDESSLVSMNLFRQPLLIPTLFLFLLSAVTASVVCHDKQFIPDHVLRITAKNATFNCESRYSVLANGTSPGPTIRLREGKTTWIRVYNDMATENLTMHWHGLSQRAAPFSDGSPQASQWPIPPRYFFDYELHPVVGEAGTYFYHSHIGFQAVSCGGALIVDEAHRRKPPFKYDGELIVQLADYFNKTDRQIEHGLVANPFAWSGETNALLVNGHSGTNSAGLDASCAPAVLEVEPGKTYRMRFIGGTAISFVSLGIEDHPAFNVIEADAAYTKPHSTSHLQIASGQRFSTLFKAKSAEELSRLKRTQFWIQLESRDRPTNSTGYALLSYKTADLKKELPAIPTSKPILLPQKTYGWLEYALEPLHPRRDPFPPASAVTRRVTINVEQVINGNITWMQNTNSWHENKTKVPYLVDIYLRGQAAIPNYDTAIKNNGWDPQTLAFPAKMGEVIELVWQNGNGPSGGWDFHPFHAHGRHFWDIGSGNGTYNATANEEKLKNYHPVRRDTTVLHRYANKGVPHTVAGWRAWRFKVDTPGVWMLHCHVLQHMIMGMQTAWVFGDADDILRANPPRREIEGYLQYRGSAYGNSSFSPDVLHQFE